MTLIAICKCFFRLLNLSIDIFHHQPEPLAENFRSKTILNNEVLGNTGIGINLNPGSDRVVRGNNSSLNLGINIFINSNNLDVEVVNNIAIFTNGGEDIVVFPGATGIIENNICAKQQIAVGGLPFFAECPPNILPGFDIDH